MNTKPVSSKDRDNLLTILRTAKQRKIMRIQESLPSIRRQTEQSVADNYLGRLGLVPLFDKVRSLRTSILGTDKPSNSILDELASVERQIRILGFDVNGVERVFIASQWRERERETLVELQIGAWLKDERERHLKLYDDAMARVKGAKTVRECREIVDSVLAA